MSTRSLWPGSPVRTCRPNHSCGVCGVASRGREGIRPTGWPIQGVGSVLWDIHTPGDPHGDHGRVLALTSGQGAALTYVELRPGWRREALRTSLWWVPTLE